jgi:hypothetical protein
LDKSNNDPFDQWNQRDKSPRQVCCEQCRQQPVHCYSEAVMRNRSLLRVASIGIGIGDPFDDVWTPAKLGGTYLLTQNDAAAGVTYAAQPNAVALDLDMEAAGVAAWTPTNATRTKVGGAQPDGGSQALQVLGTGAGVGFVVSAAGGLIQFNRYLSTGWARGDGVAFPRLSSASAVMWWDGTTSAAWQAILSEQTTDNVQFLLQVRSGIQSTEWASINFKNLSATTLNCLGSLGNLAQATAANMGWTSDPLAPTSIPRNGRRVLYFDGTADHYVNSIAAANHPYHKADGFVFSRAYRPDNAVAGTDTLVDTCNATNTNHGVTVEYDAANQQIVVKVANGSGAFVISKATGANSCTKNAWHVVSVSWSEAAGVRILIDGAAAVTEASVGAASANNATATLQDGRLSGNTNFLHGAVGDLYMRVGWVPDDSLLKTHNYMRQRYAI